MENQLQLFNFKGNQVRTVTINDDPYFVGKDVAEILGYKDLNRAINQHVDSDDRKALSRKNSGDSYATLWSLNDWTNKVVITESGVYSLIFSSELPQAKEFKHWVTSDVLPTIRKHGAYMTNEKIEEVLLNPDTIIKLATELKKEREGRMMAERKIQQDRPKVVFADAVSVSNTPILIGELAKILKQNGVETLEVDGKTLAMGPNNLFKWMRANNYLISRKGTDYNSPTARAMNMGLFRIKESTHVSGDGVVKITKTPKVTGKGQQYFINKFLDEDKVVNDSFTVI